MPAQASFPDVFPAAVRRTDRILESLDGVSREVLQRVDDALRRAGSLVKRGPSEDEELNELANERQIFKALAQRLPHDQRSRIEALLMCFPQYSDHAPAKNQATARDVSGPASAGPADAPGLHSAAELPLDVDSSLLGPRQGGFEVPSDLRRSLEVAFAQAKIESKLPAALELAEETGLETLEELQEDAEFFFGALKLKRYEERRLREAVLRVLRESANGFTPTVSDLEQPTDFDQSQASTGLTPSNGNRGYHRPDPRDERGRDVPRDFALSNDQPQQDWDLLADGLEQAIRRSNQPLRGSPQDQSEMGSRLGSILGRVRANHAVNEQEQQILNQQEQEMLSEMLMEIRDNGLAGTRSFTPYDEATAELPTFGGTTTVSEAVRLEDAPSPALSHTRVTSNAVSPEPTTRNAGSTRVDLGPIDPDCPINPEPSDLLRTVVGAAESVGATSVGEAAADQVMGWRQARDVSSQGPQLPAIPPLQYFATIHNVDQRTVLEAALRHGKNSYQCMSGEPVDIDAFIDLLLTLPDDFRSDLCLDLVQGVDFHSSLHNTGAAASMSEKSLPVVPPRASVAVSHKRSGNSTNPSAFVPAKATPVHVVAPCAADVAAGVRVVTVQTASGGLDVQQGHGACSLPLPFAAPIQREVSAATSSLGLPQYGARIYPPTPRPAPRSVTPCSVTPRSVTPRPAIIW